MIKKENSESSSEPAMEPIGRILKLAGKSIFDPPEPGIARFLLYVGQCQSAQKGLRMYRKKQSGFTLIEIAIVLVIIGLLLGGVLKGQELITSARVRNLISQQDGYKAAFFGFQDRYRALPGDYLLATTNINGATVNGNGNGQIEAPNGAGVNESIAAWEHLSKSGFINGSFIYKDATTVDQSTTPSNPYSVFVQLVYDDVYGQTGSVSKLNLKTGNQIPVEILAEVDRKIDDGNPYGGTFQFSDYSTGAATQPVRADCVITTTTPITWNISSSSPNCGAASLF